MSANWANTPAACDALGPLVSESIGRLRLDLAGLRVLTEAATGAYAVTPVIAAAAGARVVALTRASRHGSVAEVRQETARLAERLGVSSQITVVDSLTDDAIRAADIVTNSGHLRPLDEMLLGKMKQGAVIPLMYESWELRRADLDLDACRRLGIAVAGTNECHPDLRVFDYLGMLAVCGLLRCRVPVAMSRLLLICDNAFAPYIAGTLAACQAELTVLGIGPRSDLGGIRCRVDSTPGRYDAVIVADTPEERPIVGSPGVGKYTPEQIGSTGALVQVWGDVDRSVLGGVDCWPPEPPPKGHMGVQLAELGPEPVVRLQAGGLKVGEVLCRRRSNAEEMAYCQPLVCPGAASDPRSIE